MLDTPDGPVAFAEIADALAYLDLHPTRWWKTAPVTAVAMPCAFSIETLEGVMKARPGDYLAGPGAAGEYWPVRARVFESTHRPVTP